MKHATHMIDGSDGSTELGIMTAHRLPRLGKQLNDATLHGARADDAYGDFLRHVQQPLKTGLRFSRKARMPSDLSCVSNNSRNSRFSSARAASSGKSRP